MPDAAAAPAIDCEWGPEAVAQLAPRADVVVIVDVLSFTTCVSVAVERGAAVLPYRYRDDSAAAFAAGHGAVLAGHRRREGGLSLSPVSLQSGVTPGMRLVLPSPNGSTLSLATGRTPTLAACLRNATAVARAALQIGPRVVVVPAGERWPDSDTLRPAMEDWLGAGAVLTALQDADPPAADRFSAEARLAAAAFRAANALPGDLADLIRRCASGRELIERGFDGDVAIAVERDTTSVVPQLIDGAYVAR